MGDLAGGRLTAWFMRAARLVIPLPALTRPSVILRVMRQPKDAGEGTAVCPAGTATGVPARRAR